MQHHQRIKPKRPTHTILSCIVMLLCLTLCANAVVNVMDYGALGDGMANDTSAIQSALNSGQDVMLPEGQYRISLLTINTADQTLLGPGTIIPNGDSPFALINMNASGATIDGVTFDMRDNGQVHGLMMNGANTTVKNCTFIGRIGQYIRTGGTNITVSNNTFNGQDYIQTNAILIGSDGFTVSGNEFNDITGFNIQTHNAQNGQINNNQINNPTYRQAIRAAAAQTNNFVFTMPDNIARFGIQINGRVPGSHTNRKFTAVRSGAHNEIFTITLDNPADPGDIIELFGYRTLEPFNINANSDTILIENNSIDGSGDSGIVIASDYDINDVLITSSGLPPANFPENITVHNNQIRNVHAAGIAILHAAGSNFPVTHNDVIDVGQSFSGSIPWSSAIFDPPLVGDIDHNSSHATIVGTPVYHFSCNNASLCTLMPPQNILTFQQGDPSASLADPAYNHHAAVIKHSTPATNYNTTTLNVGTEFSAVAQGEIRSCLTFDLSHVGAGAVINSVTLTLTHTGSGSGSPLRTINAYPVDPFDETTAAWNTFVNQTFSRPITYAIGKAAAADLTPITFASSALLVQHTQQLLDNNHTLNLMLVVDDLEGFPIHFSEAFSFYADDAPSGEYRPKLIINYTPVHNSDQNSDHTTIQSAIDNAQPGDTITIAAGTYPEDLTIDKDMTLTSVNPQNPEIPPLVRIQGSASGPAVTFTGSQTSACTLTGLTIAAGHNPSAMGGAISANNAQPTISHCIIRNNYANFGGAIANAQGVIANCLIYDNTAVNGAALYNCSGLIINCTIAANNAISSGGGAANCSGTILNTIVWNNSPNQLQNCTTPFFSCVQNTVPQMQGNIAADPLFVDAAADNYQLQSQVAHYDYLNREWVVDSQTSPAIDAAAPVFNPATESSFADNRRVNMGFLGNTPYASKSPENWSLPADLNNSGNVDINDFAMLAENPQPSAIPLADLNRDETVDITDFILLSAQWLSTTVWH